MKLYFFFFSVLFTAFVSVAQNKVDLGLSVYWSDINYGAKDVFDPGEAVWWGDVTNSGDLSIWNEREPFNIASTKLDIVRLNWGDKWRMPTTDDIQELIDNCSHELIYKGDIVYGVKFTAKNGNSIIIPAGGAVDQKGRDSEEGSICIWTGTFNKKYNRVDFMLCNQALEPHIRQASPGRYQFCVRPVRNYDIW